LASLIPGKQHSTPARAATEKIKAKISCSIVVVYLDPILMPIGTRVYWPLGQF
jgi:hypothetical protein